MFPVLPTKPAMEKMARSLIFVNIIFPRSMLGSSKTRSLGIHIILKNTFGHIAKQYEDIYKDNGE